MNECPRCGRLESHTEICALQGEIERLLHDIERHIAIASELATENEALRTTISRLTSERDAAELFSLALKDKCDSTISRLREYAKHHPNCDSSAPECCCGLDRLLEESK